MHQTFQHTAARRRLETLSKIQTFTKGFNTQPPEGGWVLDLPEDAGKLSVSTHSRPKAAGDRISATTDSSSGFNTQPPEGGWAAAPS